MSETAYQYAIRDDIKESLDNYATHRYQPGGFLMAVLANDLTDACGRADSDNAANLHEIVKYIYNELPGICWGSRERVTEWLKRADES
jgi:hypothetical protein